MKNLNCGIYEIRNTANDKIYIGSSMHLDKRLRNHRNCLNRGTHINPLLQRSWDKYGEDAFDFRVLLYCDEEERGEFEEVAIRACNSSNRDIGYNLKSVASGTEPNSMSKEGRESISRKMKGNTHSLGKVTSPEVRLRQSKAQKGKKLTSEHKEALSIVQTERFKNGDIPYNKGKYRVSDEELMYAFEKTGTYGAVAKFLGYSFESVRRRLKNKGIESKFNIAELNSSGTANRKYPFNKLKKCGDEVEIEANNLMTVRSAANTFARRKGIKLSCNKISENKIKVKRVDSDNQRTRNILRKYPFNELKVGEERIIEGNIKKARDAASKYSLTNNVGISVFPSDHGFVLIKRFK